MGNNTKKWGLISSLIVVSIILIVAIVYQFKEKPPDEVVKMPTIKEENDIEPQTKKVAESEIESIKETQSKEKETVIDIEESTEGQTEVQTQEESKEVNEKVNNEIQTIKQKQVENQTPTEMSNKKQVETVTEMSKEIIKEQTESTTKQQVETQTEEQTESTTEQQSQKYSNRYVFTGKIICGECGSTFKRQIVNEHKIIKWCCKQHIYNKTKCDMKSIKEEHIQRVFKDMCNKLIENYKVVLITLLEDLKRLNYSIKYESKVQYINNKIKELKEQSYILSRLKSKGTIDSAFYIEKNNMIIKQINQLKKQYKESMNLQDNKEIYNTEKIINIIKSQKGYIEYFDEKIFSEIVEKIIIISSNEIVFQLINGLKLTEYIERS